MDMVEMAATEPMAAAYAAHAAHAAPISHAADMTSSETEATRVTSAESTMTEAATTEATAMTTPAAEAATPMTTAAPTTSMHQRQQTAPYIRIGINGIDRLRERCRGRKSKRKSTDDTKRDDAVFHDCTTRGQCTTSSLLQTQAIGRHLPLATDPPSGFFLKGACKLSVGRRHARRIPPAREGWLYGLKFDG
jgi:hypothetical protein